MKTPLHLLLLICAVAFAPSALVAQTSPSPLSSHQLNEGFKSGLNTVVNLALIPGSIKVSPPSLVAKAEPSLAAAKKADVSKAFNNALNESVAKVTPKAADLIKNSLKTVKIDDAQALLTGGSDAGTQFFRKAVKSSVRDALMPMVKQATTATDLTTKAKAVLNAIDPAGVKGGSRFIVTLDDYICDQVINQSFKLIAEKEAAVRANPDLLKGNALAQKVFASAKK